MHDPWKLPKAFSQKWCVSIKSVCYFNSALLWWFEGVHCWNYQSQSRQSHGSYYRLRNWTVKNIHHLHLFHTNTGKVQIIQSSELTVIFTWTPGCAWQLGKHHWVTLLTSFPTYLHVDLLVNCTQFKKYILVCFKIILVECGSFKTMCSTVGDCGYWIHHFCGS